MRSRPRQFPLLRALAHRLCPTASVSMTQSYKQTSTADDPALWTGFCRTCPPPPTGHVNSQRPLSPQEDGRRGRSLQVALGHHGLCRGLGTLGTDGSALGQQSCSSKATIMVQTYVSDSYAAVRQHVPHQSCYSLECLSAYVQPSE
jgi:hypothetical protein